MAEIATTDIARSYNVSHSTIGRLPGVKSSASGRGDAERYRLIPFMRNGKAGKEVNLHPLLERAMVETSDAVIQQVKQEQQKQSSQQSS